MSKLLSVTVILVFTLGIIAPTFAQESPVVVTTQGTQITGSESASYTFSARTGQIILVTAIEAKGFPEIRITPPDEKIERFMAGATEPLLFRAPTDGVYTLRVQGFNGGFTTGNYTFFIREVLPIPLEVNKPAQLPTPTERWMVFSFNAVRGEIIDIVVEHATPRKLAIGTQSSNAYYALGFRGQLDSTLSQRHAERHVLIRSDAMQLMLLDFGKDFQQPEEGFTITVSQVPVPLLNEGAHTLSVGGIRDETNTAFAAVNVRGGTTYRVILREMNGKPLDLRVEFDIGDQFEAALGVRGTVRFRADILASTQGRMLLTLKNQAEELRQVEVSLEAVDNSS